MYDLSGREPTPTFSTLTLFGPERTVPGKSGYYASAGLGQPVVEDYEQGGVFLQDDVDFAPWLEGIFGLRCDILAAQSGAPALGPVLDPTQKCVSEAPQVHPNRLVGTCLRRIPRFGCQSLRTNVVARNIWDASETRPYQSVWNAAWTRREEASILF